MATNFKKQIESINDAALHFGQHGYHCTIQVFGDIEKVCITVYFSDITMKEKINRILCCFKDEEDTIEFKKFEAEEEVEEFYTFKLKKGDRK